MKNKKKNLVCMLAMASLVLPSVANTNLSIENKVQAQDSISEKVFFVVEGNGGGTGTSTDPFKGFDYAIKNAPENSVLKLNGNVVYRFPDNTFTFPKNVTIDGGNNTLTLSGNTIKLNADVTLRNLNLTIQKDGQTPKIFVSGHKLELDNVGTLVSDRQPNERPEIYGGTYNGEAGGSKSQIIIKGTSAESKFAKIVASNENGNSSIPVDILIENPNTEVFEEVNLSGVNSPVKVVTKSDRVKNYVGEEGKDITLTFEKAESEARFNATNVTISNIENVNLKNATVRLRSTPFLLGKLNFQGSDSLLVAPISTNSFDEEDVSIINIKGLAGEGVLEIPENSQLHFSTPYDGTGNVKINNIKELVLDTVYADNVGNGTLNFSYGTDTANKVVKDGAVYKVKQEKIVTKISNDTLPLKLEYKEGDRFNPKGAQFTLTYNNDLTNSEVFDFGEDANVKAYIYRDGQYLPYKTTDLKTTDKAVWIIYGEDKENSNLKYKVDITVSPVAINFLKITKYKNNDIPYADIYSPGKLTLQEGEEFTYEGMEVYIRYENGRIKKVKSSDFEKEGIKFNIPDGKTIEKTDREIVASIGEVESTRVDLTINEKPKTENTLTINYKHNGIDVKTETVKVKVGEGYTLPNEIKVGDVTYVIQGEKKISVEQDKAIDVVVKKVVSELKPLTPAEEIKTENTLTINYKHNGTNVKTETVKVKVGADYTLPNEIKVGDLTYVIQGEKKISVEQDKAIDVVVKKVVSELKPLTPAEEIKTENTLTINYKHNGTNVKTETVKVKVGADYTLPNEIKVGDVTYVIQGEKKISVDMDTTINVVVKKVVSELKPLTPAEEIKTENIVIVNYKHNGTNVKTETVKVKVGADYTLPNEIKVGDVTYVVQGEKKISIANDTTLDVEVKKVVSGLMDLIPSTPISPEKPENPMIENVFYKFTVNFKHDGKVVLTKVFEVKKGESLTIESEIMVEDVTYVVQGEKIFNLDSDKMMDIEVKKVVSQLMPLTPSTMVQNKLKPLTPMKQQNKVLPKTSIENTSLLMSMFGLVGAVIFKKKRK